MAARGTFYGLTKKEFDELTALPEEHRPLFLCDTLYDRPDFDIDANSQDVDKAWDALHRCLGELPPDKALYEIDDSYRVTWIDLTKFGSHPLNCAVLGGTRLYESDNAWLVHLVEPGAVAQIAEALRPIERDEIARRYAQYCDRVWPEFGEDDLEYTWEYFQLMREFYQRMAEGGRWVVFVADQ